MSKLLVGFSDGVEPDLVCLQTNFVWEAAVVSDSPPAIDSIAGRHVQYFSDARVVSVDKFI